MKKIFIVIFGSLMIFSCSNNENNREFHSKIAKWPECKNSAVSITYDGGTINQFNIALPIMEKLNLPATFFIVTGSIQGSKYQGKFIGKSIDQIIKESEKRITDKSNFYERASALQFAPYDSTREIHILTGTLYERNKVNEAYGLVDKTFEKIRNGDLDTLVKRKIYQEGVDISWEEIENIAKNGHEFASHTITHPQLSIMNNDNIRYELEMSKEELNSHLGRNYTFTVELPYAIETPRVLDIAFEFYESARNKLVESYIKEINRWDSDDPSSCSEEYVFWEKGPKTRTELDDIKSWIDTCLNNDHIWLVLVIHGIEGIGWEPVDDQTINDYFQYIHSKKDKIWVATYRDVLKYIRERMNTRIKSTINHHSVEIELRHSLDQNIYNLPLTLKTNIPSRYGEIEIHQNGNPLDFIRASDSTGSYISYQAYPNNKPVIISFK